MNQDQDIYIYYEKSDNNFSEGDEYGWVDNFRRFLKMILRQILGQEPRIMEFSEEMVPTAEKLQEIKTLILVMSPNAVKSTKPAKVFENFMASRKKKGISSFDSVFKVLKAPVELSQQPESIRHLIAYDLFDFNPITGQSREFDNFFSQEAEVNYWMKMVDLAYDINEVLTQYRDGPAPSMKEGERMGIYLAETGPELVIQRNMAKRELQRLGYSVFPKQNLSPEGDLLRESVVKFLDNCFVSVHLFGEKVDPEEELSSTVSVTIQNEIVSSYIRDTGEDKLGNFSRLIWLSPNFRVVEEKQQSFIEKLRRDVEDTGRTEIFQTPFEDFKFILKKTLSELPDRLPESIGSDAKGKSKKIYLIYDKKDLNNVKPLIDSVSRKGYEILRPTFDGDLLEIRKLHIQNLVDFDGVIIYSGNVNEYWVRMKLLDILKSPGFGRLKSLDHKAIVSSGDFKLNRDNFKNYDVELIESNAVNDKVLEPFLTKLN